jgi:hypothetical protein
MVDGSKSADATEAEIWGVLSERLPRLAAKSKIKNPKSEI